MEEKKKTVQQVIGGGISAVVGTAVSICFELVQNIVARFVVVGISLAILIVLYFCVQRWSKFGSVFKTLLIIGISFIMGCAVAGMVMLVVQNNSTENIEQTGNVSSEVEKIDSPTDEPTTIPMATYTTEPIAVPTTEPTATPTAEPTATPTAEPTATPTAEPTATPTAEPTATPAPTNTPKPVTYVVTFDSKGGSSIAAAVVESGAILSNFPIPQKDYHEFVGWKHNGQIVASVKVDENIILESEWVENEKSGWVKASAAPSDVQITDTKWIYTLTETTESEESALAGWIYKGSRTEEVGNGTFEYATFPSGFDTSSTIYKEMHSSKDSVPVASGAKREIVSDSMAGYVYWHYSYPLKGCDSAGNRFISKEYHYLIKEGGYTDIFCAFKSDKNYTDTTIGTYTDETIYKIRDTHTSYEESGGSYWWLRFEYYKCTYRDVKTIYQYYRTSEKESSTEISNGNGITNAEKWVRYRER